MELLTWAISVAALIVAGAALTITIRNARKARR